jgi:hypothetical protein
LQRMRVLNRVQTRLIHDFRPQAPFFQHFNSSRPTNYYNRSNRKVTSPINPDVQGFRDRADLNPSDNFLENRMATTGRIGGIQANRGVEYSS